MAEFLAFVFALHALLAAGTFVDFFRPMLRNCVAWHFLFICIIVFVVNLGLSLVLYTVIGEFSLCLHFPNTSGVF